MTRATRVAYDSLMNNQELLQIIKDRKVDLVIYNALFNDFFAIIADHLKVPYITHNSAAGFPYHLAAMGAPKEYASVPTVVTDFDDRMTFFQRMINMIKSEMLERVYKYYVVGLMDELFHKDFPETRSTEELQDGISLTIVNSHPTTAWPRSLPPTVISIGALHTRPAKPLPEEFDIFASGSENGFIVFTLGSAIPVSSMPKETLQTFINVFSKLKQKVIWKWEADIPANVPKNILMSKWLPQQDLLGHGNARVFITHGGLQGTQEAIYHAVPLLCLPFGNDQIANAKKASREGFGISLDWSTLNEDILYDALTLLINDPTYKANASRVSGLMRDEPMPGREVAAYWVLEHVLRHGGTKHLQSPGKNMPFYQRHLLDVFAFLSLLLSIVLFIGYRFIRWIVCLCFRRKTQKLDGRKFDGRKRPSNHYRFSLPNDHQV